MPLGSSVTGPRSIVSCPAGTVCKTGQCIPPEDEAGAPIECTKASDCTIGETCKANQCVPCGAHDDAGLCTCTTSSECATGQECYHGDCVTCGHG